MYKTIKPNKTTISVNESYVGETIENKIRRITTNKEPIKDGAPIIYTPRSEGVRAEFDIRTDRFDLAVEKMDFVHRSHIAKRQERADLAEAAKKGMTIEELQEAREATKNGGKPTSVPDGTGQKGSNNNAK